MLLQVDSNIHEITDVSRNAHASNEADRNRTNSRNSDHIRDRLGGEWLTENLKGSRETAELAVDDALRLATDCDDGGRILQGQQPAYHPRARDAGKKQVHDDRILRSRRLVAEEGFGVGVDERVVPHPLQEGLQGIA